MEAPSPIDSREIQAISARVLERCDVLARYSEDTRCLTRTFCSSPMRAVHSAVGEWMREAGLKCRIDPIGNLIGRREPAGEGGPTFVIGSHLDTVPNAGRYDGILGVLLGIALSETMRLTGANVPFALEVIGFSDEEGIRYQTPFLGSRAVAGCFDQELLKRVDGGGIEMSRAIRAFGLDPAGIAAAAYHPAELLGFLEVHIEQGPVLENERLPVGTVEAIAGQTRASLCFQGIAGHAGTIPMSQRRDALAGAARFIVEVEELGRRTPDLVATVGRLDVQPNAPNVVPAEANLSIDVRHRDDGARDAAVGELRRIGESIARKRGLAFTVSGQDEHSAVRADPRLTNMLDECVQECGIAQRRMISGAGHDAEIMASITPVTMLFLRCGGGISHRPDESVLPGDVEIALNVMARFVIKLAESTERPLNGPPSQ